MINNPIFFTNPYYRSSLNSTPYTKQYPNNNFNNYYANRLNTLSKNYQAPYSNNYYKYQDSSSSNNKYQTNSKKEIEEEKENSQEPELFEIFGIKLYFDDILLICLIFFLYNEGVKDQYLFISLILLLLT